MSPINNILTPTHTNTPPQSVETMIDLASTILWSSLELVISIAFIGAYAHILCFAGSLVLRNEQSLEHSNDPDLPKKEQWAALSLTGVLAAVHLMLVFVGLDLLGHGGESFAMKVILSCAFLAAGTTGIVIGGIVVWLLVPAFVAPLRSLARRVSGVKRVGDVEAVAEGDDSEVQMGFLEKSVIKNVVVEEKA